MSDQPEATPIATAAHRIRAYHPASGSVLVADVTRAAGRPPFRSFEIIPDGLLQAVVIREGVWTITDVSNAPAVDLDLDDGDSQPAATHTGSPA